MKVLVVDGPLQGNVHDVGGRPQFEIPVGASGGNIEKMTHYIHNFYIFGQAIKVASIHINAEDIQKSQVIAYILSEKAKETLVD
jgi:ribosomal protein S3